MRLSASAAFLFIAVLLAGDRVAPDSAYPPKGIGKWDAAVTQENVAETICKPGYTATVRAGKGGEFGAVTQSIKNRVYARDGKTPEAGRCCEVDHAFPLELGGANVTENLWAESWEEPFGARRKDRVETKLHRLVCSSATPLVAAQQCLEEDWVRCGQQIGALKP